MTDIKPLTATQIWYQNNKEYVSKYNREYHLRNKEHTNKLMVEYNRLHKEQITEYRKQYALDNKEVIRKRQREYYRKAKEKRLLIEAGLTPEQTIEPKKRGRPYKKSEAVELEPPKCLTPDILNAVILNNQRHIKLIEEQRILRLENQLMSNEDINVSSQ